MLFSYFVCSLNETFCTIYYQFSSRSLPESYKEEFFSVGWIKPFTVQVVIVFGIIFFFVIGSILNVLCSLTTCAIKPYLERRVKRNQALIFRIILFFSTLYHLLYYGPTLDMFVQLSNYNELLYRYVKKSLIFFLYITPIPLCSYVPIKIMAFNQSFCRRDLILIIALYVDSVSL